MKRLTSFGLAMLMVAAVSGTTAAQPTEYSAVLNGGNEIPANESLGRGSAIFELNSDGTELSYRLIASNIDNIVAAHIHVGAADVNGPVVAFLFGNVPAGGGRHNGVLSTGTITAANLVGPLAGQPLSALIAEMNAGNTYTNVHTNDGVAPPNTGPGDFPGGEIRGQNF